MYLLITTRKSISSLQLGKEIGITQKSAWFILHSLREACGTKLELLQGTVEVDENSSLVRKTIGICTAVSQARERTKTIVLGMRQRGGIGLPRLP